MMMMLLLLLLLLYVSDGSQRLVTQLTSRIDRAREKENMSFSCLDFLSLASMLSVLTLAHSVSSHKKQIS